MAKTVAALLLLMIAALPGAAQARVFIGFGFPFPFFYPAPYYYPPAYYYPPPAYYYPPAAPAPAAVAPTTAAPAAGTTARNCKTFRGNATMDGSRQPFYGTACLEADGKWHIVP